MDARVKEQGQAIPRSKIIKEALTGKEREDALKRMDEIAQRIGARARAAGIVTDEDVLRFISEP